MTAINLVSANTLSAATGGASSIAKTYAQNVGVGSGLIALVSHEGNVTITGVADSINGAWTKAIGSALQASTYRTEVWYFQGPSSGNKPVVTASFSAATGVARAIMIFEASDAHQTAFLGQTATRNGTNNANGDMDLTMTLTVAGPRLLMSGLCGNGGGNTGAGSGFTRDFQLVPNWYHVGGHRAVSAAGGPFGPAWRGGAGANYTATLAEFVGSDADPPVTAAGTASGSSTAAGQIAPLIGAGTYFYPKYVSGDGSVEISDAALGASAFVRWGTAQAALKLDGSGRILVQFSMSGDTEYVRPVGSLGCSMSVNLDRAANITYIVAGIDHDNMLFINAAAGGPASFVKRVQGVETILGRGAANNADGSTNIFEVKDDGSVMTVMVVVGGDKVFEHELSDADRAIFKYATWRGFGIKTSTPSSGNLARIGAFVISSDPSPMQVAAAGGSAGLEFLAAIRLAKVQTGGTNGFFRPTGMSLGRLQSKHRGTFTVPSNNNISISGCTPIQSQQYLFQVDSKNGTLPPGLSALGPGGDGFGYALRDNGDGTWSIYDTVAHATAGGATGRATFSTGTGSGVFRIWSHSGYKHPDRASNSIYAAYTAYSGWGWDKFNERAVLHGDGHPNDKNGVFLIDTANLRMTKSIEESDNVAPLSIATNAPDSTNPKTIGSNNLTVAANSDGTTGNVAAGATSFYVKCPSGQTYTARAKNGVYIAGDANPLRLAADVNGGAQITAATGGGVQQWTVEAPGLRIGAVAGTAIASAGPGIYSDEWPSAGPRSPGHSAYSPFVLLEEGGRFLQWLHETYNLSTNSRVFVPKSPGQANASWYEIENDGSARVKVTDGNVDLDGAMMGFVDYDNQLLWLSESGTSDLIKVDMSSGDRSTWVTTRYVGVFGAYTFILSGSMRFLPHLNSALFQCTSGGNGAWGVIDLTTHSLVIKPSDGNYPGAPATDFHCWGMAYAEAKKTAAAWNGLSAFCTLDCTSLATMRLGWTTRTMDSTFTPNVSNGLASGSGINTKFDYVASANAWIGMGARGASGVDLWPLEVWLIVDQNWEDPGVAVGYVETDMDGGMQDLNGGMSA